MLTNAIKFAMAAGIRTAKLLKNVSTQQITSATKNERTWFLVIEDAKSPMAVYEAI